MYLILFKLLLVTKHLVACIAQVDFGFFHTNLQIFKVPWALSTTLVIDWAILKALFCFYKTERVFLECGIIVLKNVQFSSIFIMLVIFYQYVGFYLTVGVVF